MPGNLEGPNSEYVDAVVEFLQKQRQSTLKSHELSQQASKVLKLAETQDSGEFPGIRVVNTPVNTSVSTTTKISSLEFDTIGHACLSHRYSPVPYGDEFDLGIDSRNILQINMPTDRLTWADMESMVIADPEFYQKFFTRYYFPQNQNEIVKVISLPIWWQDNRPLVETLQTGYSDPWFNEYVARWRYEQTSEIKFVKAEMTPADFTLVENTLTTLGNHLQREPGKPLSV